MTVSLISKAADQGNDVYYLLGYKRLFEDHIEWIRGLSSTVVISITPEDAYTYEYRPELYLKSLGYSPYMYWFIMRLNYMYHFREFTSSIRMLYIPNQTTLQQLASAYNTNFGSV